MPTHRSKKSPEILIPAIFVVLMLLALDLAGQNPYIQHYTTFDGLPTNTIYYIFQDSKKFIWFATDAGVVRYDGTTFTNYRKSDGLSSSEVIRIKEDAEGRIWFFHINGRLNFMDKDRICNNTNATFLDSIKNKKFFINFFEDKDRKIFFYNNWFEIYCLDGQNRVRKYDIDEGLVRNLTTKKRKDLLLRYFYTNTKGEFILWAGYMIFKLNHVFKDPVKISDSVDAWQVWPGRNGSFYTSAYQLGIFKFNDKFQLEGHWMPFKMPVDYAGIKSILEDNGGLLWIVTFDKGVYCLRNKQIVQHFDIKEGQSVIQDNESNIWISSMKDGVYKISPYLNEHRHYENSIFRNMGVRALDARQGSGLWFTNGVLVYLLKNNEFYTFNYQMEDFPATDVFQLRNNTLIIGTKGSYFYFFTGIAMNYSTKKISYKSYSKTDYSIKGLEINKGEDKLSSFGGSTVCIYAIQHYFSQYRVLETGEHINNAFYDLHDDLIVNANNNYIIHNDSIIRCKELSLFDYKIIKDHLILNDSVELFNIEGDCIYLKEHRKLINLTAAFTSPIDLQVRNAVYEKPTLYLSTFRNIYKCDNPLQVFKSKPVNLQVLDINFRNIHDILINNDSLYIASDDGLTIIPEVLMSQITTHTPIPYIQSVFVNDREADLSQQKITLTGDNRIKFIVSSINYSSTPVIYSYMLEGADHDWINGTGRVIVYQDLPVGNYVFKLRTGKPNSSWSRTVITNIVVKAHFWQLPVFFIFLSFLFTGLTALIIIRRKNIQIIRRELDNQLITLEQKALQSMMNPHFIFNSLGSIQNYLLQKKSDEAGLYLSRFARLIRQNLNAINAAYINLEEEIDRLKNYLDLQKQSMENKFEYLIEVDESVNTDEIQIPSMIIQPFVENAISHGMAALTDNGQINIRFRALDQKSIKVIVEDNGVGMKHSETQTVKQEQHLHLGLEMTRKRLELLGRKFSVDTKIEYSEVYPSRVNPGTRVELVVPVLVPAHRLKKFPEILIPAIFVVLMLLAPELAGQNPYIQHYTTSDGLPSNSVHYIYQDSKKFIWFATDAGVSRYDGSTFTNYRNKDGLSSNDIIRIKEDSLGRIWFFNFNANVDFYYHNKIFNKTNTPFLHSIENKTFFIDFFQDKDQSIYFYNDVVEIFRLNRYNQVKRIDIDINLIKSKLNIVRNSDFLLRYLNKSSGNEFILWINGKIIKSDSLFKTPSVLFDSIEIWKVFPGRSNNIYFSAYGHGIFKVTGGVELSHVFLPFKMPYMYPGIKSILEDSGGFLWVVTFDKGVYCLHNNRIIRYIDIKQGLSIIQDNENNLWISSLKDGVYRISPYLNTHIHYENSLFQNMGITCLYSKPGWGLWLTNSKSVYLFRNKTFYRLNYFIENSLFTQVGQMKNNTLIIGVEGSYSKAFDGISLNHSTKLISFNKVTNSPEGFKKISINKNGDKISAISGSSVYLYNTYKSFHTNNEIKVGEHILNIFYDINDELVINANKNYLCRNNKIIPCKELTRFDKKAITDHLVMNDVAELFNLEGDSIYLYNRKSFFNLTAALRSPIDLQVKKIMSHGTELYLSTARNIYKCDNPLNIIDNKTLHLQLLDINFRNIQDIQVHNDSLYIASDDGLTVIPEELIGKIETHIPIPYFQSILINDKETDITSGKLQVKSNNKITFNFSCINYSSTPILYSYKLVGLDSAWTTGSSRNVVYQNMSIGNYFFQLRVRKSTAEWSPPVICNVVVNATFWQHPLFYLAIVLLFMGLVILVIIYRKNIQIKRRDLDHQLITLEQKALQSMMNPHFIFNSLGSIQNFLLQKRSGEAGLYLSQFARLIRQNLNAINTSSINLEEEIERLRNYLDLEKLRMENKFNYHIEVDENLDSDEVSIPSMILQPFVENAIWHGIAALEEMGQINIRFRMQDEKSIKVIVEDNGIGMKRSAAYSAKQDKHLHLGLEMTRKRLELLSKKFTIETALNFSETYPDRTNPGTRVEMLLPVSY